MNVLYNNEKIYELEKYKNLIKRLIQVSCRKVNKEKILYQAICKEIKEKMNLYIILIYLKKNKRFNYDLYIIEIGDKIS